MTIKHPIFTLILLGGTLLLLAACGAGEALVERGMEEVVDRAVGEGTMATAEAAMEDIQEGIAAQEEVIQEMDTDGDGEISEAEQQDLMNQPGSFITNPLDLTLGTPIADTAIQGTFGRHYRAKLPAGAITTVQFTNNGDADIFFSVEGARADLPESVSGGETVEATFVVGEATDVTLSAMMILGTADFELLVSAETQNDGASGGDAGVRAEPTDIEAAAGLTGQLGGADTEDAFRIRVPGGQFTEVKLTNDAANNDTINFFVESTNSSYYQSNPILPGNSATLISAELDEYFVTIVVRGESSGGSYMLDIVPTTESDFASGADISDKPSDAMSIGFGQPVRGTSVDGDQDCYALTVAEGQAFEVELTTPAEQAYETTTYIEIYGPEEAYLTRTSAEFDGSGSYQFGVDNVASVSAGDYVFCAYGYDYYPLGVYEFQVTAAQ